VFLAVVLALLIFVPAARAEFAIDSFSTRTTDAGGALYSLAGGHPFQQVVQFSIHGDEDLGGTYLDPPQGFIANPAATARCRISALLTGGCPPESRVGFVRLLRVGGVQFRALHNLVPERGYQAQFGFEFEQAPILLSVFPRPRAEGYGITLAIPTLPSGSQALGLVSTFCGFGVKGDGSDSDPYECEPPAALAGAPFLSNPADCSRPPLSSLALDTLQHPGALLEAGVPDLADPDWKTLGFEASAITGCEDPLLATEFARAELAVTPRQDEGPTAAEAPTGLMIGLAFPQPNDPTDPDSTLDPALPQTPAPKKISLTLPEGLAINPAGAGGLGACSDLASDPAGDQVHYDNTRPVSCPDASRIGTATALSPLLAIREALGDQVIGPQLIEGGVYVLKPHPGDLTPGGEGTFRFLVALESPRNGVDFKLPATATADPRTGQLTIVFTETPQIPLTRITISLKKGPRAPLVTPVSCGTYETTSELVPFSSPGTPDAHPSARFEVESGPGDRPCPASARPFAPVLEGAGTVSDRAGAESPLTFKLSRPDGDQELDVLSIKLPPGLSAKLAGLTRCSDHALAAAERRSGAAEQADPSCPASSRIGTVVAGAGPGAEPFYARGTAYLAGPRGGAPFTFALITPALTGPFDLGNLVFRADASLDRDTAQLTIATDPLPRTLDGIPLRLRSLTVTLDRPGFIRNPTSCEPMAITGTSKAASGQSTPLAQLFQVGGCAVLPFKPRVSVRLSGALGRNGRPALRARIAAEPGQANISRAALTLPATELLDYDNLRAVCARPRYFAGSGGGKACVRASRYGHVRLFTPLLDEPLEGPLYLRASGKSGELPDLVASLDGDIHLDLAARVTSARGLLRVVFDELPDVPVKKVVLRLDGGKRGLLVNTSDLCPREARTAASFVAHNGKRRFSRPPVDLNCGTR
jgi:hypothetical protein